MTRTSLFLDIDGTLIELARNPESVTVPENLPGLLQCLEAKLGGALALVSGRRIETIDHLLFPYRGAAVGVHGLEHRASGSATHQQALMPLPDGLRTGIVAIVSQFSGAFIEDKGGAIAVHERGNIDETRALGIALSALCDRFGKAWHCMSGHRVFEIKPLAINKGSGLESIMRDVTFAKTFPVAIGDDTTDIDMFAAARRFGGMTVAVGDRVTDAAQMHLKTPASVLSFLRRWADSSADERIVDIEAMVRLASKY